MWNPFSKNVAALLLIGSLSCATVSGTLIFEKLDDRIEYDDAQKLITIPETVTNMEGTVHLLLGTITSDVCGNCVKDGNHQITVAVEEENKLYLKRQLDYDSADLCTPGQKCQKTLRFREDSGSEQVLTVEITDENDNKPYFKATEDCRSLNVAENDDTGPTFCVLEATDDDYDDRTNTDNPSIIAKLENYRDLFELIRTDNSHEFTLKLQNGKSCDYETNYIHRLQISLTDGEPGHESILQSVVEVEDKPDMPPVWNRLSLSTKILETHEVGAEVLKFQAVDGDRGVNDKMNYEINVGPNVDDHTYFKYVENTETNEGTIELALHLDASKLMETRGSLLFEVGVKAVEREDPHDKVEEIISINIVDENINPVLISKNNEQEPEEKVEIEASCKETDKDCVISFTAIDKDVDKNNNKFEASWSTNADPGLPLPDWFLNAFVLEKSTGQAEDLTGYGEAEYRIRVKDAKYIDYDTIPEWRDPNGFTIKVTIKGVDDHKPAEAIITIHIENENDNSPYFPAEDDDEGEEFGKSSLSYEWEPNSRIPDYLEMDRTKGLITVTTKEAFDYEMFKSETFIVRVSDNRDGNDGARKNQITVSLKIIVVNINDEQPSIRAVPSRLSIDENTKNFKESEFKLNPFDPDEELSDLKCTLSVEDYLADSNVHK
ncbi:unnamed protein product [Allacma fusca]|uniref:Cadherin domain-containing protein n=1 Tax=Allacma fusca TaxID=39272 RepID=A0A8J2LGG5_9HEXA|nr:unnamed protein product [Allacma fusca]